MKRGDFLKGLGIIGAGAVVPLNAVKSFAADANGAGKTTGACVLIPSETEGPFPLDLTTTNSATYFRQDVREDRAGSPLHLKLKIIGLTNCLPMGNESRKHHRNIFTWLPDD